MFAVREEKEKQRKEWLLLQGKIEQLAIDCKIKFLRISQMDVWIYTDGQY